MKRRLLLVCLAVLVTVLTVEATLQIGALVARGALATATGGSTGDEITILCVGDSHTYGAGVERHQAYPAQLETALRRQHPGLALRVANLGVPGVNSSFVARRLEGQILTLKPKLVMVWVGTNNMWNTLEAEAPDSESIADAAHRALLHLKLYRLGMVLWHTRPGAFEDLYSENALAAQKRDRTAEYLAWKSHGREPRVDLERQLASDMRKMVETARSLDVPILFVTYPQRRQELPISDIIEETANALGVPVVVTANDRARALDDGFRDLQLFVFAAGPHPAERLYGYIVESMLPLVTEALGL